MPECHHMNQGWKDEEKACENEEVAGGLAEGLYSPGLSFLPRPFCSGTPASSPKNKPSKTSLWAHVQPQPRQNQSRHSQVGGVHHLSSSGHLRASEKPWARATGWTRGLRASLVQRWVWGLPQTLREPSLAGTDPCGPLALFSCVRMWGRVLSILI